jgi:hypothetical protein
MHPIDKEVSTMYQQPLALARLRKVPKQFSWVDQRLVREHYIDALSHPACALSLFLLTVADAQGLSYYAESTLCRRLALSQATLRQARQELITHHLVAYRRPLYQVLALESHDTRATEPPAADDPEVDLKAVFARIWEALS